ncbi:microneme protein, putative [Eimeria necatrix]|uniref:Microneme protein, putative n=1 Tax=Eimeria necatrix TaxID=51315 RepID=U6MNI4_9EIME|nr:microneme protein, putative [Eimeria necatrix]CDJ64628.1 microneme protein, putative [Eimeria necatrix]
MRRAALLLQCAATAVLAGAEPPVGGFLSLFYFKFLVFSFVEANNLPSSSFQSPINAIFSSSSSGSSPASLEAGHSRTFGVSSSFSSSLIDSSSSTGTAESTVSSSTDSTATTSTTTTSTSTTTISGSTSSTSAGSTGSSSTTTAAPQQALSDEERIAQLIAEDTPKLDWSITEGWTLPENNIYRNYLCRFSALSAPCWDSIGLYGSKQFKGWPVPLYCPPGNCCASDVDELICMSSCTGGGWAVMSSSECNCSKHQHKCPQNTVCDEQDTGNYGGVYCRCKDGYVGDGVTCYPDPCADSTKNKCSPGTCKSRPNGSAYCKCPEGYTWDGTDPYKPTCAFASMCDGDPCGPPEAVLECRTDKAFEYTCVCRPGYEFGTEGTVKKCIAAQATVTCADEPCGTEGLLSCTDTAEGPECVCDKHYRLVTEQRKKRCIFSPCEFDPCGDSTAAKSCEPGISTYTCVCNKNYKLDTIDGQPKCVEDTVDLIPFIIGAAVVGVLLLITLISCFVLRRRMLSRNAFEAYAQDNLEVSMGAHQDGINVSSSAWM